MDLSFVEGLVDALNVKSANPFVGLNANACALCTYFIFPFFSWWFQPMHGWPMGNWTQKTINILECDNREFDLATGENKTQ